MIKKVGALPIQIDINLRGVYNDFLWAGFSYRTTDAVVVLFGLDYNQSSFGYSYDITTSSIRIPSAGTHGLLYSYRFKSKQRDRDNDGVLDEADDCPKIPGLLALNGCPDRDKDGIKDSEDDCPDDFGLKINNGCPDMDGDGIIDKNDECPKVPGLKNFRGCPDTVGDGLQDAFDDSPKEYGCLMNKGCPVLEGILDTVFVIRTIEQLDSVFNNIEFEFNKAILTFTSQNSLDKAGKYLDVRSKLKIHLVGHTDDIGSDKSNMKLSKHRVKAVQKYLVDRGILKSRIEISWKGESKPISAENSDNARSKNRRVELKILNNEN
jgi:outer membrane protein OmpA-like peptidoglycan-associated protein